MAKGDTAKSNKANTKTTAEEAANVKVNRGGNLTSNNVETNTTNKNDNLSELFPAFRKLMVLMDRRIEAAEELLKTRLENNELQKQEKSGSKNQEIKDEKREDETLVFARSTRVEYGGDVEINMGVIDHLMKDSSVSDILINGYKDIYVERNGRLENTSTQFNSAKELEELSHKIAAYVGRRIDSERPLVDARLPDGSRVNIIAPPLALNGFVMSIRKFSADALSLDDMVAKGILSPQLSDFLKSCAQSKVNIIVSGGTGSGKTTLLNAISQYISTGDRIVTIEDSAELQLKQPHVVKLETKIGELHEDKNTSVTMHDLLKNTLRMRPDRIIIGEVRGVEAFDMIQAMNTGHEGSMTTLHANTPRDAIMRIENMISMKEGNIPQNAIRKQIASAIHVIVQTARLDDGSRRIVRVAEIIGMEGEVVTMQELFAFKKHQHSQNDSRSSSEGQHLWSGVFPRNPVLNRVVRNSDLFSRQAG